ncbi:MAG: hypothetical protein WCD50_06580, partial [Onishia taeanensis]
DWLNQAPDERWMLVPQRKEEELACADLTQTRDLGLQNNEHWWLIPGPAFVSCAGDATAAPLFVAPTTLDGSAAAEPQQDAQDVVSEAPEEERK